MANTLRKKADSTTVPGSAATAGQAPYCTTEEVVVDSSTKGGYAGNGLISSSGGGGGGGSYNFGSVSVTGVADKYQTVPVTVCFPGTPATAAKDSSQASIDHTGWNAGGRSVKSVDGDFTFSFQVTKTPAGVLCGLSDGDPDRTYAHIDYGFLCSAEQVAVVEQGVTQLVVAYSPASLLATAPVFAVKRARGVVSYAVAGEDVYVSDLASSGVMYAEANLYAVGDFVYNPSFGSGLGAEAHGTLRIIGESSNYLANTAVGTIPVPVGAAEGRGNSSAAGTIPRPVGAAYAGSYATASGRLPAITGLAVGQGAVPIPNVAIAAGKVPAPVGNAVLLVGAVLSGAGAIPALTGISADYAYSYGGGSWPHTGYQSGNYENLDLAGTILFLDYMIAADSWLLDAPYVVVAFDSLDVSSTAEFILLADAEAFDYLSLGSRHSIGGTLQLMIKSGVAISDQANGGNRTAIQYAVDVLTGALTEYQGFDFTHFTRCNGETYACRPDGLYRLRGQTDDGETIRALVDMGASEWGDPHLKYLEYAYVGVATDGEVFISMTADDGVERTYRLVTHGNVKRSKLSNQLSANKWSAKLEFVDSTFASLDLVQFKVNVSKRTVGGRRR